MDCTVLRRAARDLSGSALKVWLVTVTEGGNAPTLDILQVACGLARATVVSALKECVAKGWMQRADGGYRAVQILDHEQFKIQTQPVQILNSASEESVQNLNRHTYARNLSSSESNDSGIDSESRLTAATETDGLTYKPLEDWRRTSEDLARHSCHEIGDGTGSLGYHIAVWNHARKGDKQRGGKLTLTDGVFAILGELAERRRKSGQRQGKAWTRRTLRWFEDNGVPLPVKIDEAQRQEVRVALANAPFMQKQE